MVHPSIAIDREKLADICRRYHIRELCIFGSATRDDFGPESDVDLLVEYEPGREPDYWDVLPELFSELESCFRRSVDLVQGREALVNPYRRQAILGSLELLYAA